MRHSLLFLDISVYLQIRVMITLKEFCSFHPFRIRSRFLQERITLSLDNAAAVDILEIDC